MKEILPGVFQFQKSYSNIYILDEKAAGCLVIVDTGFPSDAKRLVAEIKERWKDDPREILVVPSHLHPDHVGDRAEGLIYLAKNLKVQVVLPESVLGLEKIRSKIDQPPISDWGSLLEIWRDEYNYLLPPFREIWRMVVSVFRGYSEVVVSDIGKVFLVEDGGRLPLCENWIMIFTPNHTKDSICLYNPEKKVLLTGDTILSTKKRGGDLNLRADEKEEKKIIQEKLGNLKVEYILSGHGDMLQGEGLLQKILGL